MGLSISEKLLKKWFDHVYWGLDCMKKERRDFEKKHNEGNDKNIFLLPHEYLFLLCNTSNRLNVINEMHRPNLKSKLGNIY